MYVGEDFLPTTPNEKRLLAFDFSDAFVPGDNIESATWTLEVSSDSTTADPAASTHIAAPFSNNGSVAAATLSGCVGGCRYYVRCVATAQSTQVAEFESYIDCAELQV